MLNSHCVTPGAVMVKILHDPTNDDFSVFFFFFFIGNRLSLWKIKFTFPLTFVLIVSHYSLPHPLALFLLASLGGSPPQSERLEEAIRHQRERSQGVETLIRALWFSCDAEQDWNQLAFPLSIRCQGKKNGAVQLKVRSDLLLYTFRSLQSIIRFDI